MVPNYDAALEMARLSDLPVLRTLKGSSQTHGELSIVIRNNRPVAVRTHYPETMTLHVEFFWHTLRVACGDGLKCSMWSQQEKFLAPADHPSWTTYSRTRRTYRCSPTTDQLCSKQPSSWHPTRPSISPFGSARPSYFTRSTRQMGSEGRIYLRPYSSRSMRRIVILDEASCEPQGYIHLRIVLCTRRVPGCRLGQVAHASQ